jgi:hypothetical protein
MYEVVRGKITGRKRYKLYRRVGSERAQVGCKALGKRSLGTLSAARRNTEIEFAFGMSSHERSRQKRQARHDMGCAVGE